MNHSNIQEQWMRFDGGLCVDFHCISYVIFRNDFGRMTVIGARCPDMASFSFGANAVNALGLDEESQSFLLGNEVGPRLLAVRTKVGLGFLDKRYDGHTGVAVYWHVHGHGDSLARMINNGILGSIQRELCGVSQAVQAIEGDVSNRDATYYEALARAWHIIGRRPGEWTSHQRGLVYRSEIRDLLEEMSSFVGCGLRLEEWEAAAARIKINRPVLLEAVLLCLLTEARICSATRDVTCRLGSVGDRDGERMTMELCYPLEESYRGQMYPDALHRYLEVVTDLGGLSMQASVQEDARGAEVQLILEWLRDPAVMPTSDLKARVRFQYDEEASR